MEDLGIDGSIREKYTKVDIKNIGFIVIYLIHMAEDRDRWWALLNTKET